MPGSHQGSRGKRQDGNSGQGRSGSQKEDRKNMQEGGSDRGETSQSGEGRGWHGDSEGHSKAAKKGSDR